MLEHAPKRVGRGHTVGQGQMTGQCGLFLPAKIGHFFHVIGAAEHCQSADNQNGKQGVAEVAARPTVVRHLG